MSHIKDNLGTIYLVVMDEYDINGIFYHRMMGNHSENTLTERYVEPGRLARLWWNDEHYYHRVKNAQRLLKGQLAI